MNHRRPARAAHLVRAALALSLLATTSACRHGSGRRSSDGALVLPRPARDPNATELVVQTGHHAAVDALAFSADGRLLATGAGDRLVKLWDLASRRELDTISAGADVNAVALSPDGHLLAVGTGDHRDGTLALYDVRTGALLGALGGGGRKILSLAFSPDGALLASGGADGDGPELTLWTVSTRSALAKLKGHKEAISALGFTGDGRTLVTTGWDYSVKAWSVADPGAEPRELGTLGTERARGLDVAGGLAAFDAGGGAITVVEVASGRVVKKLDGAGPLVLDRAGRRLACVVSASGKADVQLFDLSSGTVAGRIAGASELPTPALAFSADGRLLATGAFGGDVRLWEADGGREVGALAGAASYFMGAAFARGAAGSARLVTLGGDSIVSTWDLVLAERAASVQLPRSEGSSALALAVATAADRAVATERSGRAWLVDLGPPGGADPKVAAELPTTTDLASVAITADGGLVALGTNRGRVMLYDGVRGGLVEEVALEPLASSWAVAFAPSGKVLAAAENEGVVLHAVGGSAARVHLDGPGDTVSALAWSSDGARLAAGTFAGEVVVWKVEAEGGAAALEGRFEVQAGKVRSLAFDASGARLVASGDGSSSVWDVASRTSRAVLSGHVGGVPSASFGAGDALVASAGWDGTVRVYGAADGKERARLVSLGRSDFVISAPSGHYRASRGGLRGVAFRHQDRVFPFEQFDLLLDRPDRVLESLGLASKAIVEQHAAAAAHRLKKMGLPPSPELGDALETPELRLTARPPLTTKERRLTFEVLAEAPAHGLERINVWANDVPVFGSAGLDARAAGKALRRTIEVELAAGVNKLQVSALDRRGVESLRETFVVRYDAPSAPRDLYVLLVGVSSYGDAEHDLGYPAKDARDLAALFGARHGDLREVKVRQLLDREATRANVLGARAFLEKTRTDDQVVVFIAGHGLLDDAGGYAFATADVDFDRPAATGLSFDAIEALLDGIPAREKLLLVDTCHAGELSEGTVADAATQLAAQSIEGGKVRVRGLRSKSGRSAAATLSTSRLSALTDLFADLRRGSGTTVIAAAGGAELAYESQAWNNGVFTYAILEGLRTKKADADGDGAVRASELRAWVTDVVRRLTLGVQVPTVRRENVEADFRVY